MQLLETEQDKRFKVRLTVTVSSHHSQSSLGVECEIRLLAVNRKLLELNGTTLLKKSVSLQVRDASPQTFLDSHINIKNPTNVS